MYKSSSGWTLGCSKRVECTIIELRYKWKSVHFFWFLLFMYITIHGSENVCVACWNLSHTTICSDTQPYGGLFGYLSLLRKSRKFSLTTVQFIVYKSSHSVFMKPGKWKLGENSSIVMVSVSCNDTVCVWNYRPVASDTDAIVTWHTNLHHRPVHSHFLLAWLCEDWNSSFLQFECIQTCFVTVVLAVTV